MISGGFTINGGAGIGYLHIYTNASTTFSGPAPAVGLQAQVTGTGSATTSITATSVTTTGAGSPAPIPTQGAKISTAGPVTGTFSGGFTINAGKNVGYIHIYTNASTIFNGGAPAAGSYVQVTGTGSLSSSITGTYVTKYATAPSSVTDSGTAVAATSYGFTLNDGTNVAVPIVMNAATIVGGAPLVAGSAVKVTGTGAANASITAQQIVVTAATSPPTPTPPPISTTHVMTADYLGAPYGTTSIAWSAATPYLTWAQVSTSNANAVSAAGIKTQYYIDPNREVSGDPLYNADETTFAHDCNGNRVSDTYNGTLTQYVMDPSSASMQTLFATYIARIAAYAHYDALYEDDAGPLSGYAPYTPFTAMPCNYSDSAWLSNGLVLNNVPPIPVIYNGLSALNGHSPSLGLGLLASTNTIGANYEHCYSDNAQPKMNGWNWQAIEDSEIDVVAAHKLFECQLRNSGAASSSTDARIYAYASFLLTYDPATSIYWSEFATTSGLHVFPEAQLVATNPKVAAPGDISGLLQNGGAYGREFGACYIAGNFVGPCAAVVNPDSQLSHAFPYPQYTHTLVLSGGGVLDGGTAAANGPAPPLSLAPSEAAIVFP